MILLHRQFSVVANRYLQNAYKGWEGNVPETDFFIPKESIDGDLPSDLKGTYLRNGPGLIKKFGQKLAHPIDGDGMVCALTFSGDGLVHFKNKFVNTEERTEEEDAQMFLYRGQMGSITDEQKEKDSAAVQKAINSGSKLPKIKFRNPSNTNVWHWGDRFISTYETSMPYSLDPYTLETIGKDTFNDTLHLKRLGAHFRIDTTDLNNHKLVTGAFARSPFKSNAALEMNQYNQDFTLAETKTYKIDGLTYFHDFAIIDGFYVVHKSPFVTMNKKEAISILSGKTGPEFNMKYNSELPCQFLFLPKNDVSSKPIVVDTPLPFHMYHFGTCYRSGDNVILTATILTNDFDMSWSWKYWLSNMCKAPGKFIRFDINLKTASCDYTELDPASNEFPCSHPYRHGHFGTRYNYLMACDEPNQGLPFMDIVKVNMEKDSSFREVWRADGLISECVFAPRAGYDSAHNLDEDDGWLITQYFNPDVPGVSQFLILNAKEVEAGPVCRIKLDFKLNYPFHGTFTPSVFLE